VDRRPLRAASSRPAPPRCSVPGVTVEWVDEDAAAPARRRRERRRLPRPPRAQPALTFEQFVIGDGNRMAHAAALAVAEMPGIAYNPLYICGAPGLGKTHLLHSIAAYVEAHGDGCRPAHHRRGLHGRLRGASAAARRHGGFRAAHRDVDVLLVDDVQFLQRKQKTEEEFFHTFNALVARGAQVVLTSDRPPRDLAAWRTACASASRRARLRGHPRRTSAPAARSSASASSRTALCDASTTARSTSSPTG
jgi:chromosomal replication initiator protein